MKIFVDVKLCGDVVVFEYMNCFDWLSVNSVVVFELL